MTSTSLIFASSFFLLDHHHFLKPTEEEAVLVDEGLNNLERSKLGNGIVSVVVVTRIKNIIIVILIPIL